MAKISAVDSSRPAVEALVKYHFWLLAVVVPLVLLPLLFMARGELVKKIEVQRGTINGHIKAMEEVRKITQHPNESWTNDIDASTMRVKRETFAEWRRFWASQQPLRVWPAALGNDFVEKVEALKADGKLSRKLLERYQNNTRTLVRDLPKRMGVEDAITDAVEPDQLQPAPRVEPGRSPLGAGEARVEESPYAVTWNAENQNRIAASFKWDKVPSTAQVLLGQEELWVYGLLCDAVARVNKSATGPHNAAIAVVDELSVGYPAAEDNPGGQAGGRITRVAAQAGADGMAPPPGMAPPGMAPPDAPGSVAGLGRPPNPRFTGAARGGPPGGPAAPDGEGGAPSDPDAALRNWIYVDFAGKPLDAAALAAAADCQMVHLMPFVLRVVIDQRQIDSLLVDLATSQVPIDVRQLRINAGAPGSVGGPPGADPGTPEPGTAGRLYDVNLELRGTVGLATPPDEKAVGLEPGQADEPASQDSGDKTKAAVMDRFIGRRRLS
jgi:hypothetical protein